MVHAVFDYRFESVHYGDLTGDGREDALVVLARSSHHPLDHSPRPESREIKLVEPRGGAFTVWSTSTPARVESIEVRGGLARVVHPGGQWECLRLVSDQLVEVDRAQCRPGASPSASTR